MSNSNEQILDQQFQDLFGDWIPEDDPILKDLFNSLDDTEESNEQTVGEFTPVAHDDRPQYANLLNPSEDVQNATNPDWDFSGFEVIGVNQDPNGDFPDISIWVDDVLKRLDPMPSLDTILSTASTPVATGTTDISNQVGDVNSQYVDPIQTQWSILPSLPPSTHIPFRQTAPASESRAWPAAAEPIGITNASPQTTQGPSNTSIIQLSSSPSSGYDYWTIPAPVGAASRRSYVVEPERDENFLQDFTGFMPDQAWLSADNLPPVMSLLDGPVFKAEFPQGPTRQDRTYASNYVVNINFNHILPSCISWKVEGWRTLYWKTLDSRLQNDDIIDRMPWKSFTDYEDPNSGCPYGHRGVIRQLLTERERKWRLKFGGWSRKEASKGRASADELSTMERLIQGLDLGDPTAVFRTCQHNTVWKIDWNDNTMQQPRSAYPKAKKTTENYLGHKFPLPPPKPVLSDRVMKAWNRVVELSQQQPDLKASEAARKLNEHDNNQNKRKATIASRHTTDRAHRPPPPKRSKKPTTTTQNVVPGPFNPPLASLLFPWQDKVQHPSVLSGVASLPTPKPETTRKRQRDDDDDGGSSSAASGRTVDSAPQEKKQRLQEKARLPL